MKNLSFCDVGEMDCGFTLEQQGATAFASLGNPRPDATSTGKAPVYLITILSCAQGIGLPAVG